MHCFGEYLHLRPPNLLPQSCFAHLQHMLLGILISARDCLLLNGAGGTPVFSAHWCAPNFSTTYNERPPDFPAGYLTFVNWFFRSNTSQTLTVSGSPASYGDGGYYTPVSMLPQ